MIFRRSLLPLFAANTLLLASTALSASLSSFLSAAALAVDVAVRCLGLDMSLCE